MPTPSIVSTNPQFHIEPQQLTSSFDREPFGFTHSLSQLDIFRLDLLYKLAERMAEASKDYFVTESAPSAGAKFYSVPHGGCKPHEAIERLESDRYRIVLKRPENHHPAFRHLIEALFQQISESVCSGLRRKDVTRLEAAILISSAATTTPFHLDPEIGFFSQIEGEKIYHVYSPSVIEESELERFYRHDVVSIGQLELEGRDRARENVFHLGPGLGLHQPQNAPHWVETRGSRSISYTMVFQTGTNATLARVRAFNHYARKLGVNPPPPSAARDLDRAKARAMHAFLPLRKGLGNVLRKAHLR